MRARLSRRLFGVPSLLASVALVVVAAPDAHAQSAVGVGSVQAAGGKEPMPMHVAASLTSSVGSGTFVTEPGNPFFGQTLTLNPIFLRKGWVIGAWETVDIEWTQSDLATTSQQLILSDLNLTARYQGFRLPEYGLTFALGGGYALPISLTSRQAGSAGTLSTAARVAYLNETTGLFGYFGGNAGYNLLVRDWAGRVADDDVKTFDDRNLGVVRPVTCNARSAQELSNYACNGLLPSQWRWGLSTGLSWWKLLDGNLGFALDLGYSQGFSVFTGPDDELKADNAVAGLVPRQFTTGNLSATYLPLPWLFLTVGTSSFQPALTADGKAPRFPLWDFVSPYSNLSQVYFDMTIQI